MSLPARVPAATVAEAAVGMTAAAAMTGAVPIAMVGVTVATTGRGSEVLTDGVVRDRVVQREVRDGCRATSAVDVPGRDVETTIAAGARPVVGGRRVVVAHRVVGKPATAVGAGRRRDAR